jgi:tetratricopeptide (TPR) repeat protein
VEFQQDDVYGAAKHFIQGSAWSHWVNGKAAFAQRRYKESNSEYQQAIALWREEAAHPPSSLLDRITPTPRMSRALAELGGAQLVAGEPAAAITTLDEAIRLEPGLARALYLRGRAKDATHQTEPALADYNLASRNALASAEDLASGEAHLYRGVMLYRRGEFEKAEDEFSNALNFDIQADLRPDAEAWRYMAAVAGGDCGTSREKLERSLETASPFFPKAEARTMAVSCTGPSTWLHPPAAESR